MTVQVPNRSVTYAESDYFDVNIVGLLADCAPSLSLGDIATNAKSCDDVEWKYRRACNYRKNGWLLKILLSKTLMRLLVCLRIF